MFRIKKIGQEEDKSKQDSKKILVVESKEESAVAAVAVAKCLLNNCNDLPHAVHAHSDVMLASKRRSRLAGQSTETESKEFGIMMRSRIALAILLTESAIWTPEYEENVHDYEERVYAALGVDKINKSPYFGRSIEQTISRSAFGCETYEIKLFCHRLYVAIDQNIKNMQYILTSLKKDEEDGVGWQHNRDTFRNWVEMHLKSLREKVAALHRALKADENADNRKLADQFNPDTLFQSSTTLRIEETKIAPAIPLFTSYAMASSSSGLSARSDTDSPEPSPHSGKDSPGPSSRSDTDSPEPSPRSGKDSPGPNSRSDTDSPEPSPHSGKDAPGGRKS